MYVGCGAVNSPLLYGLADQVYSLHSRVLSCTGIPLLGRICKRHEAGHVLLFFQFFGKFYLSAIFLFTCRTDKIFLYWFGDFLTLTLLVAFFANTK